MLNRKPMLFLPLNTTIPIHIPLSNNFIPPFWLCILKIKIYFMTDIFMLPAQIQVMLCSSKPGLQGKVNNKNNMLLCLCLIYLSSTHHPFIHASLQTFISVQSEETQTLISFPITFWGMAGHLLDS